MKENISQKLLVEVLIREVETLQAVNKELGRSHPLVKEQIERLQKTPLVAQVNTKPLDAFQTKLEQRLDTIGDILRVDEQPLKAFETRLNKRLKQGEILPGWLIKTAVGLVAWAILATGLAVWWYRSYVDHEERAIYWREKTDLLEKELARRPLAPAADQIRPKAKR